MTTVEVQGVEGMKALLGQEIGPSDWRTVTQADIDTFAALSGDDQWIHVDVERAERESPFGTTIAHGNLTLSMIDGLAQKIEADNAIDEEQLELAVNMGWNRVRFPAPVLAGARVRATAELLSVEEKGDGWWEVVDRYTVETEDSAKPACVAESVARLRFRDH